MRCSGTVVGRPKWWRHRVGEANRSLFLKLFRWTHSVSSPLSKFPKLFFKKTSRESRSTQVISNFFLKKGMDEQRTTTTDDGGGEKKKNEIPLFLIRSRLSELIMNLDPLPSAVSSCDSLILESYLLCSLTSCSTSQRQWLGSASISSSSVQFHDLDSSCCWWICEDSRPCVLCETDDDDELVWWGLLFCESKRAWRCYCFDSEFDLWQCDIERFMSLMNLRSRERTSRWWGCTVTLVKGWNAKPWFVKGFVVYGFYDFHVWMFMGFICSSYLEICVGYLVIFFLIRKL